MDLCATNASPKGQTSGGCYKPDGILQVPERELSVSRSRKVSECKVPREPVNHA